MRSERSLRIVWIAAIELAIFGLVSSVALALRVGFPLGEVTPGFVVQYVWLLGMRPEVWGALGAGALAAALAPFFWFARTAPANFGDARFARRREAHAAGLCAPTGILLGKLGRKYLRSGEPLHVLVCAPTRSGKGVGVVIPNLLSWSGSAVVMDIKYENHRITSGFRERHGPVYRFSPADPSGCSHRYNPLDAVRSGIAHRISDLQRLAAILVPPPAGGKDSFWQDEARVLFVGIALYVLDTPALPHSLGEIYRTLMAERPLDETCLAILRERDDLDPVCRMALGSYTHKSEKERSGVRSTLTAALSLWSNPMIDAATSASDFDLEDLRRQCMTVYVAVTLDQLPFVAKLLNVFFQQAVTLLAQSLPGEDEPHRVLFLLDEFASLGRMDVLRDSLAFLAEYGVRVCTVIQGLGQLDALYGRAGREAILQNSAIQVLFAANDETTARYVSDRLGTKTIRTVLRSFAGGSRVAAKTYGSAARALLLPEEVRQLGPEEALLFKEGVRPVRGGKIRYYRERAFQERLGESSRVPELEVRPAAVVRAGMPVPEVLPEADDELDRPWEECLAG